MESKPKFNALKVLFQPYKVVIFLARVAKKLFKITLCILSIYVLTAFLICHLSVTFTCVPEHITAQFYYEKNTQQHSFRPEVPLH